MADISRFSVSLNPELAEMVEDYRFNRRISTKSKAVQQLLEIGIQSAEGKKPDPVDGAELTKQEQDLIRIARGLEPFRQELLFRIAKTVAEKDSPHMS